MRQAQQMPADEWSLGKLLLNNCIGVAFDTLAVCVRIVDHFIALKGTVGLERSINAFPSASTLASLL